MVGISIQEVINDLGVWDYKLFICFAFLIIIFSVPVCRWFRRRKNPKKSKQQKKQSSETKKKNSSASPDPSKTKGKMSTDQEIRKRESDKPCISAAKTKATLDEPLSISKRAQSSEESDQQQGKWVTVGSTNKGLLNNSSVDKISASGRKKRIVNQRNTKEIIEITVNSSENHTPSELVDDRRNYAVDDAEEDWQEVRFSRKGGKHRRPV